MRMSVRYMSDAANWSRVRDLFSRALDMDPPRRAAFLREACGGDSALHAEVSSLLAAHADAGSLAEGSPLDALDASARVIAPPRIARGRSPRFL